MTAVPASQLSMSAEEPLTLRLRCDEDSPLPIVERSPLRIGVNLLPLALRVGGMRQYVLQLLPELVRRSPHHFVLFYQPAGIPCLKKMLSRLSAEQKQRITTIEISDLEQVIAYGKLFDFYFCPLNGFAPQLLDRPTMATLADVQEQYFPQYFTAEQLAMRAKVYPNTAAAVTTLLTLSEFSRQSISRSFDVTEEKIRPIHLAPNDGLLNAEPIWPSHRDPLPSRYLFYAASLYPHKNHEFLLRSFKQLVARDSGVSLVLTGHEATPGVDIKRCIEELELRDHVRWLGHVSSGELSYLYQHAQALVFPSLFEGFGMPLVEAMYFDCPIVAVPSTCIAEVVDDAALLVPPDEQQFCDAMHTILTDADLRQRLVERGRTIVKRYTVERLAETTLDAIDQTYERFWNPPKVGHDASISYVILPDTDEDAIELSLSSLLDELNDHDEILIAADAEFYGQRLRAIFRNCEAVRFVENNAPAALVAAARNDVVHVLSAGTIPCRGAAVAAKAALATNPESMAVAGDVLSRHCLGDYNGIVHLTDRNDCLQDAAMPIEAVYWRREAAHRFAQQRNTAKSLRQLRLPAGRFVALYRTVSCVQNSRAATIGSRRVGLIQRVSRTLRRGPIASMKAGVRVARRVARRKAMRLLSKL